LIPLIKLQPVEEKILNKYGRMRRAFLQEQKPMMFDDLVLTEQLFPHLYEVQEIAEKKSESHYGGDYLKRIRHRIRNQMPWLG